MPFDLFKNMMLLSFLLTIGKLGRYLFSNEVLPTFETEENGGNSRLHVY